MKIENISISNINIDDGSATISFDIIEITKNVNIDLKIDDGEFTQIATNQGQGTKTYALKDMSKGIHNLILKISNDEEEYITEPFLIRFKINPTIEGLECTYTDSTGKFILKFTILGDELFTYNINFKLDDNEYQEVMTSQVMGEKTFEATSTMGSHTCVLKVSDGYDEYETDVYSFEIVNQKPILSKVLVKDITNEGTACIHYAVKDVENSTLIHILNINGVDKVINPTRIDNFYTYEISELSVGINVCNVSVLDDIDTITSDDFNIEIFTNSEDKKEILRQSKTRYDFAYQSLKDIIMSVISDGVFDYDIENSIIQKAQESYNETYSEFNRIAQQSIDTIGTNKVNLTKEDLTTQIKDVDNALNTLETTMEGVFKDGILSESEKTLLKDNLNLIAKEKSDVDRDYETLYNNEDLIDPAKSKLQTTYNAFVEAQNSLATTIDEIINKEGIIDNEDKENIDNAFEVWRNALGDYRNASLEAIDSIAKKKIDDNTDTLNEKWAELIVDIETGIRAEVGSLEKRVESIGSSITTSVQSVDIMYYLSTSTEALEGGSWTTDAPAWEKDKYMWSKTVTTLTDGTVKETDPVCIAGAKGQDATPSYTWIRYADDIEGNGLSNDPTDKEYIGFAYNKDTNIESENPSDYKWSLIKGTDGVNGLDGEDGTSYYTWIKYSDNPDGTDLYDIPNNNTQYIGIAVNQISDVESDVKENYKWSKFKGDDGVNGSDGLDGADGVGVESVIEEYYLSVSKDTQAGGSWVTTPPPWSKGMYMWTRSKITYTNGIVEYTEPICDSSWEVADEVAQEVEVITQKVSSLEITNEHITSTVSSLSSTVDGFDDRISSVEVTANSVTSTVSSMQSKVNGFDTRISNNTSSITQLSNKITSTVTEDDVKSIIEQSPNEIRFGFNDISSYVTINTSGLTVHQGSIACDILRTPSGHDPIIYLFGNDGNCAIDATKQYNSGWGTAIRLKWDNYNYVYVCDNSIQFYQNGYGTFLFSNPTGNRSRISTLNGSLYFEDTTLRYQSDNGASFTVGVSGTNSINLINNNNYILQLAYDGTLYWNNSRVLTQGNFSSYCASASHTHSGYASSSHTHSYASTSHTHSNYSTTSHTHSNYLTTSSSKEVRTGHIMPYSNGGYFCGNSSNKWSQVVGKAVYGDSGSVSDIAFKENIHYIKESNMSTYGVDRVIKENEDNYINLNLTNEDLYSFIKDELKLCEYNYTDEYLDGLPRDNFENKLGFIAQDIEETKVGELIVGEWEGKLAYNTSNYISTIAGALQYEIMLRDMQITYLEERIEELENKFNNQ